MPIKPCHMTEMGCSHCTAESLDDCPYNDLSPELQEVRPMQVIGGDCSGDDGVCESCQ